ncbi:MAG: TIR domain-containing protein [Ktedonobacteraceae bacterium]|nr:TIR domain-containing protein [Ktedonobacteraceae bacterium]
MDERQGAAPPISIFYSYALEDEEYRQRLETHLSLLRRQGLISTWHHYQVVAGTDRLQSIESHLNTASIILLLISPDFMASDYCYSIEMQLALERHVVGSARIIPVLLRPVDWHEAPFAHIQCLPRDERPVAIWPDRDEAFVDIARGIREAIKDVHGSTEIPHLISQQERSIGRLSKQESLSRQRFIKHVGDIWITGMLERSLQNAALIELGLHIQPDAVANPWRLVMQETQQMSYALPAGTSITQVYDDTGGNLLILGEPGAGKTTLLLELARDLLNRAEHDAHYPMPTIFHLSSWAEKRQSLAAWLVEELYNSYQVPRELGSSWIMNDRVLVLLDGLDEVVSAYRSECMEAINKYRRDHYLASIVVCSRRAEYLSQEIRLFLRTAVTVQPLTASKIDEYLSVAGEQLEAVRVALNDDEGLREMAAMPLMLNILTLTYQGKTLDDLIAIKSPENRRQEVFKQYVDSMLTRRGITERYTLEQTKSWLVNLARLMKQRGQMVFYIERMQSKWLPSHQLRWLYRLSNILILTLFCILLGGLVGYIGFGLIGGWIGALISGVTGVITGLLLIDAHFSENITWSWIAVRQKIPIMLVLIPTVGLAGGLEIILGDMTIDGLGVGPLSILLGVLIGVLLSMLFGVLVGGLSANMLDAQLITKPNEGIRRSARYSMLIILFTVFFGILFIIQGDRLSIVLLGGAGLLSVLNFGGLVCIQHFLLRTLFWCADILPWNLPRFLDYAHDRILLRKVGGGYTFVHRLLLDYFASLDVE